MINAATLNIKTKPFMHTSWNQAISAAPLCTNRASVCLSVSVSHRTLDCYCWMVLYLFDFCGFHVVSCGMQEVWRYFKGHTRKCAGCIIRIKLFEGKLFWHMDTEVVVIGLICVWNGCLDFTAIELD